MQGGFLIDTGLPIVLAIVMVGIGLTLQKEDFTSQRKSLRIPIIGILGQVVGVPLLAFLVAWALGLPPELAVGLVLVAATPGGSTSNVITYLAKGNVALGIVLTVAGSVLIVVSLPIWVRIALSVWGEDIPGGDYVNVPFGTIAVLLVLVIFVPIAIGMAVRVKKPAMAARLERTVSLISLVVLLALIVGIIASLGSEVPGMLADAGPSAILLSVLAMAFGIGLGMIARTTVPNQLAYGIEFSVKNVTLGMLIGLTALHSDEIALPSAVYGVVMYLPAVAIVYLGRRWVGGPVAHEMEARSRPVLVGFDGSRKAEASLRWAAAEADHSGRPLRLVMAWGLPTLGVTPYTPTSEMVRSVAEEAVEGAVQLLRADWPQVDIEGDVVRGKPAQVLLDASPDAAILVVGNVGHSNLDRLMLGSVSSAVVTHADVPVVLVRSDAGEWREGRVVVAVDGSPASETAVEFAVMATTRRGAQLVAVHATEHADSRVAASSENAPPDGSRAVNQVSAGSLDELSPTIKDARAERPELSVTELVASGKPADAIVAAAQDAALVVVGSRGHGGFKGLLLGSVSRAVIEHAACPVAVVRPKQ